MTDLIQRLEQSPITQWAQGRDVLSHSPWLCYISVSNICNSLCKVCAHKSAMRSERGNMTPEVFERIISQLPKTVRKVYLMKQGEPLLNKHFESYAEELRSRRPDLHIAAHTNAILLKKKRLGLLDNIDSLGISVSAVSRDVYKEVHGVDKFDLVVQNLRDLSDKLLKMDKENRPHVFIDYVRQNANSCEVREDVIDFFASNFPGLSSIDFHWVYDFQGEINEGNMSIYDRLPYEKFPTCIFPNCSITFCHDGNVSYCFVEPRENRFLGNIMDQTFEEIWNGEEYTTFRKRLRTKEFSCLKDDGFYCHKCSWLWSLRGQTPQQLVRGFWKKDYKERDSRSFQQLIASTPEELGEDALAHYLEGNTSQALAIAEVLKATHHAPHVQSVADAIISNCKTVLEKYVNWGLWQEELNKENGASQKVSEYNDLSSR